MYSETLDQKSTKGRQTEHGRIEASKPGRERYKTDEQNPLGNTNHANA